jgi:hypothetical protein
MEARLKIGDAFYRLTLAVLYFLFAARLCSPINEMREDAGSLA